MRANLTRYYYESKYYMYNSKPLITKDIYFRAYQWTFSNVVDLNQNFIDQMIRINSKAKENLKVLVNNRTLNAMDCWKHIDRCELVYDVLDGLLDTDFEPEMESMRCFKF